MTARDKWIRYLTVLAYEEICVACYMQHFVDYLEVTLGSRIRHAAGTTEHSTMATIVYC